MTTLGKPVSRVDGRLKVTGTAPYVADVAIPGMAYGVVVVSPVAKGRLRALDASDAERAAGTMMVLTHRNAPRLGDMPMEMVADGGLGEARAPLQDDRIHYAGQPVAVVIANTLERATEAAARVRVDIAAELWRLDLNEGLAEAKSPELFNGEPMLKHDAGDAGAALAAAAVKVEERYTTPVEQHAPIETPAATARWDGDRLTIHSTSRWMKGSQQVLAAVLGLTREQVHVICPYIGGAFGSKGFLFDHAIMAAMAARVAGRPVKLALTRQQMFDGHGQRPPTVQTLALGATREGRLTAIRHLTTTQTSEISNYVEPAGRASKNVYACPNIEISHKLVTVNTSSPCPMRGPGEGPGCFAMEAAMDELAVATGLDPVELRLRNLTANDPDTGKPWSSYHLRDCFTEGARRFGWSRRTAATGSMRDGDELIGFGVATALYPEQRSEADARATLGLDGRVTIASATHDAGHGTYTVMTQIAADALGLPPERVSFRLGDSAYPNAPASGGSRGTSTIGSAVVAVCDALGRDLARRASADRASPLAGIDIARIASGGGRVFRRDRPSTGESWSAIMRRAGLSKIEVGAHAAAGRERDTHAFYSFGAHFVEIRFDPVTRRLRVARYVGVYDPGRVLNPKQGRSQILGGVAFGIGMTLMEEGVYDPKSSGRGRLVTASLGDYHIPVAADFPSMDVHFLDRPDPHVNPMGARGFGEIGLVGLPGAITSALFHATGKRIRDLPVTIDKLL